LFTGVIGITDVMTDISAIHCLMNDIFFISFPVNKILTGAVGYCVNK